MKKYHIVFLVLFIGGSIHLYVASQNNSEKEFERIFLKELGSDVQPLKKELLLQGVSDLPNWFWNIPSSTNNLCYAIGISDPEMADDASATKQALSRALLQFSLMNEVKIAGISDLYSTNEQNQYEELYKLTGSPMILGVYSVVDTFRTLFNEKMLLVRWNRANSNQLNIETNLVAYKTHTKIDLGWCSSEKVNLSVKTDSDKESYEYLEDDDRLNISSLWNRDIIAIPAFEYEYNISNVRNRNDSIINDRSIKLYNKGLWFGYFQAILDGILTMSINNCSYQKAMDESFKDSNMKAETNSMSRSIIHRKGMFWITKIRALFGQLDTELCMSIQ